MDYFREWSKLGIGLMLDSYGTEEAKTKLDEEGVEIKNISIDEKNSMEPDELKETLRSQVNEKYVFQNSFYDKLTEAVA